MVGCGCWWLLVVAGVVDGSPWFVVAGDGCGWLVVSGGGWW